MIREGDLKSSVDYSEGQKRAAHRVLVELVNIFREYEDEIRVVGGWVPDLMFAPLLQTLIELEKKSISGEILTTNYLNFSEPKALEKLNSLSNITLRMYDVGKVDEGFHTNHNIEQLSAKLLFDLTRNTGFEVSKGDLGECWQKSCCEWSDRQEDDICGLDQTGFSLNDKMQQVYWGTSLYREFKNIGLEVMV